MPIEILAKLTKATGGLERVDTVNILVFLTQLWEQYPCVTEYFERAQGLPEKGEARRPPLLGQPSRRHRILLATQGKLLPQGPLQVGRKNTRRKDPAVVGGLINPPPS